MSQRIFHQNNLEILTGWDCPLQYFFLCIEDRMAPDDDENEGLIFNNLRRENPGMTLEEIKQTLIDFNIIYPDRLFVDLESDRIKMRGNYCHNYGTFPFVDQENSHAQD